MAVIGIDLGTTNSLACIWKDGAPVVIKNSLGSHLTPSVVGIDDSDNIVVGNIAKERLISHPDKTASEFKRTMGTKTEYSLGSQKFTSEQLSSLVLKKIKEDSEAVLGEEVTEAIISVPAYFDDYRRNATKQAAEMSGLKVERLINEPSAAALAYMQKHGFEDGTYMVVDFGGGTLDVSIIDSFDNVMEILAVAGNNQLGGKDFNEAIYKAFLADNGLNDDVLTPSERASIYKMAENCKIALTDTPICVMSVNIGDEKFTLTLDNNTLIKIGHEVFEKIGEPIRRVLHDSHVNIQEIKDIILVGGSCKMPTVAAYIEKLTGRAPCTDLNPDTAIAIGAGIFAGMKSRNEQFKDIILTDICPFSLGISMHDHRTQENIMDFIIQRNSMLPSSKTHSYYAVADNQTQFRVTIYQGESIIPDKNIKLGQLTIPVPPTPMHGYLGDVKLTYDINGILIVDVKSNENVDYTKVILSESNTMSKAELDRCKAQLDVLRLASPDNEKQVLLIARAERIIEETLSFERQIIVDALLNFRMCLENGNDHDIRRATTKFAQFLDMIEGNSTRLPGEEPDGGDDE